jgi:hypothetical protein
VKRLVVAKRRQAGNGGGDSGSAAQSEWKDKIFLKTLRSLYTAVIYAGDGFWCEASY